MTTNKPEVMAYFISHKYKWGTKRVGVRLLENHDPSCVHEDWDYEPLVRLSDYEALQAEFVIRLDELSARNYELRMGLAEKTSECEKLRKDAELWESIHDEIHRRADKEHALADRCDFDVTIMYEDYTAIDAAMAGGDQ